MTPASVRYANPGAMYPGPSAQRFGAIGAETIGGGHKIAVFPDAESGAAAQFDLLASRYAGKSLADLLHTWSGGNASDAYLASVVRDTGLRPDTVITRDMLADPDVAVPLARAMARHEAGQPYPMTDAQWRAAHGRAFGSIAPAQVAQVTQNRPETAVIGGTQEGSQQPPERPGAPSEGQRQASEADPGLALPLLELQVHLPTLRRRLASRMRAMRERGGIA
ncbi:MAG TPA: hypothetical protein VNK52_16045 [Hyphomicrobiaceae bacterium]|nr:hypothetical protein [Hyphomicrobiaceae bacterium]